MASGSRLIRVDVLGGSPVPLAEIDGFRGATWSEDGHILYVDGASRFWRIATAGGPPVAVPRDGNPFTSNPQFLPGGKRFLYFQRDSDEAKQGFWVGSLEGKPPVFLGPGVSRALYDAASGMLLYTQANQSLMGRRLELDPPALVGDPVVIAERILSVSASWGAEFSVSRTGSLCYIPMRASEKRRFAWMDRAGKLLGTVGEASAVTGGFDLSPDEKRLVYTTEPPDQPVVWTVDMAGGPALRLTVNDFGVSPRFSSDGKSVYYTMIRDVRRRAADGSGEAETVGDGFVGGVSPDGKFLIVGRGDLEVLSLTGAPKKQPYAVTRALESSGTFSPDGRWVAYESDESGRSEIYVQGFPEKRGKWLVSPAGGTAPVWRADGNELYWTGPDGMLMAARMQLGTESVRVAGKVEALFEVPARGEFRRFRPSRDGRRFLTLEPLGEGRMLRDALVVHLNWAAKTTR